MPFSTVACQATHLQGQHQADAILPDVGEETLKPGAVLSNLVRSVRGRHQSPPHSTLANPSAAARSRNAYWRTSDSPMFGHLVWRRLPHVDDRLTLQVGTASIWRTTILLVQRCHSRTRCCRGRDLDQTVGITRGDERPFNGRSSRHLLSFEVIDDDPRPRQHSVFCRVAPGNTVHRPVSSTFLWTESRGGGRWLDLG